MRAITVPAPGEPLSLKLAEHRFSIEQIWKHGFTADLTEGIKTPDGTKMVQVRDEKFLAPPRQVSQYAADVRNGDVFPPVIITRDGYIVDGNTRVQAYLKSGVKTITAFRLHVDYAAATPAQRRDLESLGTGMNGKNGAGMNRGNIEALVMRWYAPGDNPRTLAAKIHFPEASVRRIFKIQEGRKWLTRIGVEDPDGCLKGGHYELFASWNEKMTDVILATVVTLARDARFTISETGKLGQDVIGLKNEIARLDLIEERRRANDDRIKGLSGKPSPAGQFRQALGHVLAFRDNPVSGVEQVSAKDGNAEDRQRTQEMLENARTVIDAALKEQLIVNNPDAAKESFFTSPFRSGR